MNHSHPIPSPIAPETVSITYLSGRWRIAARVGWLILALISFSILLWSLPQTYRIYAEFEANISPPPYVVRAGLAELGISEGLYVFIRSSSTAAVAIIFIAIGTLIFRRKPDERPALLFSLQLLLFGTVFISSVPLATIPLTPLLAFVTNFAFASLFFSAYLLPDGRFVPRWTRWLVALWIIELAGETFFAGTMLDSNTWPSWIGFLLGILMVVSSIGALLYRYLRVSGPIQRQQLKWIIFGLAMTIILFFVYWIPITIIPDLTTTPNMTALYDLIGGTILIFSFALAPLALGIAIMRYRLWDIDPLINRTLVYVTLSAIVIGIYALVVGSLSTFLQVRDNSIFSLLAAAAVAALFQPLRVWLQSVVNRLMYGRRDDPYSVISGLGRRLEATLTSDALLRTIVTTVREALKLPYAAITLKETDHYQVAAEAGSTQSTLVRLPIIYQTEHVGELVLAPRSPGEGFSSSDKRLLEDLARQAAIAIHSAHLSKNLQRLNAELQGARIKLVTAREEERRRLARDLHDDFGSTLASLNLRAGAIRSILRRDPEAADALAAEQQETIRATIAEVRRLVHDLRPPVLDERGLATALSELAAHLNIINSHATDDGRSYPLQINVDLATPLPPLPAAVEVATYRIVQEALTNVIRHSGAQTCQLRWGISKDCLQIEVVDDGAGLPEDHRTGLGIHSMRERAIELGGTCVIERAASGGTRVLACLPLGGQK